MKIGIQYYYCCKESEYQVFVINELSDDIISKLNDIYEEDMTEINFTSNKFQFLTELINSNDINEELSDFTGYFYCDYKFLYIICD